MAPASKRSRGRQIGDDVTGGWLSITNISDSALTISPETRYTTTVTRPFAYGWHPALEKIRISCVYTFCSVNFSFDRNMLVLRLFSQRRNVILTTKHRIVFCWFVVKELYRPPHAWQNSCLLDSSGATELLRQLTADAVATCGRLIRIIAVSCEVSNYLSDRIPKLISSMFFFYFNATWCIRRWTASVCVSCVACYTVKPCLHTLQTLPYAIT